MAERRRSRRLTPQSKTRRTSATRRAGGRWVLPSSHSLSFPPPSSVERGLTMLLLHLVRACRPTLSRDPSVAPPHLSARSTALYLYPLSSTAVWRLLRPAAWTCRRALLPPPPPSFRACLVPQPLHLLGPAKAAGAGRRGGGPGRRWTAFRVLSVDRRAARGSKRGPRASGRERERRDGGAVRSASVCQPSPIPELSLPFFFPSSYSLAKMVKAVVIGAGPSLSRASAQGSESLCSTTRANPDTLVLRPTVPSPPWRQPAESVSPSLSCSRRTRSSPRLVALSLSERKLDAEAGADRSRSGLPSLASPHLLLPCSLQLALYDVVNAPGVRPFPALSPLFPTEAEPAPSACSGRLRPLAHRHAGPGRRLPPGRRRAREGAQGRKDCRHPCR